MKYTEEEILETILAREIRKEIDTALIESIKTGKPPIGLSKVTYDSSMTPEEIEEFEKNQKEHWNTVINRDIESE